MQFTAILALVLTAVFVGTCDAQRFQQQGFRGSGRGREDRDNDKYQTRSAKQRYREPIYQSGAAEPLAEPFADPLAEPLAEPFAEPLSASLPEPFAEPEPLLSGGLGGGLGEIFRRGGEILQGGGRIVQGAGQVVRAFTQQPCCLQAFPQKCLPRVVYGAQGCQQNLIQQAWTFNDGRCSQRGIVRSVFKGIFDGMNLYNSRDSCSNNCINPNIGLNNGRRGQRFDNGGYGQRFDNYDNHVGGHYQQDRYIGRGGAQFGGQRRGGAQYRVQDRRFRD